MKRTILFRILSLALLFLISADAMAQQSVPPLIINDKKGGISTHKITRLKPDVDTDLRIKLLERNLKKGDSAEVLKQILASIDSIRKINGLLEKVDSLAAAEEEEDDKPSWVRFFGMGDVNTQSLKELNAAGRLSASINLFSRDAHQKWVKAKKKNVGQPDGPGSGDMESYDETEGEEGASSSTRDKKCDFLISSTVSFNVNAVNNDTLVHGVILFPALGNSLFQGAVEMGRSWNRKPISEGNYYMGFFGEFVTKKVSVDRELTLNTIDSSGGTPEASTVTRDTNVYFHVNNVTLGAKFAWYYRQAADKPMISLTSLVYYNLSHIPRKDMRDFRYIVNPRNNINTYHSVGAKVSLGVDNLQFFADMRHTFLRGGDPSPDRRLVSFNSNIGVVLPIEFKIGKGD